MNKNENERWKAVEIAWEAIEKTAGNFKNEYPDINFNSNQYDKFEELFKEKYQDIMNRFMHPDTNALDSHKQAALITLCCLEAKVIEHNIQDHEKVSIIPQIVAITVGLSYMKDRLNELLKKKHVGKKIESYYLPVALACDTPYMEIMSRILYYEEHEQDMQFCVLELADRYFLIEYINLIQQGIEPLVLK